MASVESLQALKDELQAELQAQLERIKLAETEIIVIKAMEAPNLATNQALTGTINNKVTAIETQMGTFGNFVKTEMLKLQDEQLQKGKGKGNNSWWKKEIMESKSVQEIGKLADGKGYRTCLTKTKNLFDQARPGGRNMIAFLETIKEEETIAKMSDMDDGSTHADAIEAIYHKKMEEKEFQAKYENLVDVFEEMDRELFTILLAKTDGEAFAKVIPSFTGTDCGPLSSFTPGSPGQLKLASRTGSFRS